MLHTASLYNWTFMHFSDAVNEALLFISISINDQFYRVFQKQHSSHKPKKVDCCVFIASYYSGKSRLLYAVLVEALCNISLLTKGSLLLSSLGIHPELTQHALRAHSQIIDFCVALLWRQQCSEECALEIRVGVTEVGCRGRIRLSVC